MQRERERERERESRQSDAGTLTSSASPSIVLCGAVQCTKHIASQLFRHHADLVGIAGIPPVYSSSISGYTDMSQIAAELGIPYHSFKNINEPDCLDFVRSFQPDVIFVTGLSQLVKDEFISIPRRGIVGFHPTPLPKGRGRAPIAWLAYDKCDGAATFFQLGNGVDNGDIFVQEPFEVSENDHASEVESKLLDAMNRALDRWLPELISGQWNPLPQDESKATYNEIRKPDDGILDWNLPAEEIYSVIRAASRPHPGAYTFVQDTKMLIWRAEPDIKSPVRGVPGRVLRINGNDILVQTGKGLLRLKEWEWDIADKHSPILRIGTRLGYSEQNEIFILRQKISDLEQTVKLLQEKII